MPAFEQVSEAEVVQHPSAPVPPKGQAIAIDALTLALKALSQRALIALSTCFTGIGLLGGWLLWRAILPSPTYEQLIAVSLYAVFFVVLEIVRRR